MARKTVSVLLAAVLVMALAAPALACTTFGVGRNASADGSVLVSHTCDGWYDHRIQIVPGAEYAPGTMMDVYVDYCLGTRPDKPLTKTGEIPQAEKTNTYFHIGYPFMNDKQVMMGEFTWSGREEVYSPAGWLYIANLEVLGLQRASTAREAVKVMGELAEKYGYGDGGETLVVGDKTECWIFEVCGGGALWAPGSEAPGAHWAAQRVPDDEVFVGANRARITEIDFDDSENFLYSTDITVLPEQMGWWKAGEPFNFADIFNPEPYGAPFYQSRREWRGFSLLAPSQEFPVLDEYGKYPFSIKPDEKVTVKDIMDIYSDHLEGTEYDLTADAAAGPFGNPNRWPVAGNQKPAGREGQDWERAIAMFRCSYSFVSQSREWLPDPVGGVLWFGQDAPDTTVYVPIYCGVTELPKPWTTGDRHVFDPQSAWWAFNLVNNYAQLRWNAMYPEIRAKKASFENVFFAEQAALEAEAVRLFNEDPAQAVAFLTGKTSINLNAVEKGWWDFAWHLIGKYYDGGMINPNGSMGRPGYPKEYLESVDFGGTAVRDLETIKK
ncbi:MAG TPA: C69 family dipeptidase [Candidatus Limnocylindria bacterium]|nr:C69 family dipeptidase [Candidatus Limnocylindria bacterium]